MSSMAGAKRPWQAAGMLLFALSGCGAQYRPVVTPITPTGPASQPTAYFVAVTSPSPTAAGLVTIADAFGDTIVGQAALSNGPFSFVLNASGSVGYNINSDATTAGIATGTPGSFVLNSYAISVGNSSGGGLRTQNINTSTIPAAAFPFNAFTTTTGLYLAEPYVNPTTMTYTQSTNTISPAGSGFVAELTGAVPALQQEIPVAPNPVNFASATGAPRLYSLSQGTTNGGTGFAPLATPNACATPQLVTTVGEADSIEVTTNTVSNRLPLGVCPVYGIMSADYSRAYVLNRGSGTVTVINSQSNILDKNANVANGSAGSDIAVGLTRRSGPVFADLYTPSSLLVTANYDEGTISVINVPTDVYGNDGPTFWDSQDDPGREWSNCCHDPSGWVAGLRGQPVGRHSIGRQPDELCGDQDDLAGADGWTSEVDCLGVQYTCRQGVCCLVRFEDDDGDQHSDGYGIGVCAAPW